MGRICQRRVRIRCGPRSRPPCWSCAVTTVLGAVAVGEGFMVVEHAASIVKQVFTHTPVTTFDGY
jgi:hypothetical protein